jgi:predicted nuclease with TOPRIM domain
MRKDIEELMTKQAAELSVEEMRIVMDEKERRAEEERQQQLQQVHRQQQKLQNEIESLTTKLQQRKQELRELQQQAAPLTHRAKVRTIAQLRDHVLTDMITKALYESNSPMTTGEIYGRIEQQMKKHAKGGKNPKQAVGSTLASGARYQAVERGLYALTDEVRAQVAKALEE